MDIIIYPPEGDPPATWWDEECDKSLLVGVYKYGECRVSVCLLLAGLKIATDGIAKVTKTGLVTCLATIYLSEMRY